MRILRSAFIGSNSDWLPSRRSELIQIGGLVMLREGHWRLGKSMLGKARYLVAGLVNTVRIPLETITDSEGYLRLGGGINDCVFSGKICIFGRLLLNFIYFCNFQSLNTIRSRLIGLPVESTKRRVAMKRRANQAVALMYIA
jgi:hypothetical protein